MIDLSAEQPKNAILPMLSTVFGILITLSLVHPQNPALGIRANPASIETLSNSLHSVNTPSIVAPTIAPPWSVVLAGMVMLVMPVLWNAARSTNSTEVGIVIAFKLTQP